MIDTPRVLVECDICHEGQDYPLTKLVSRSWDMRDLKRQLEKDGWHLSDGLDGEIVCDGCWTEDDEEEVLDA